MGSSRWHQAGTGSPRASLLEGEAHRDPLGPHPSSASAAPSPNPPNQAWDVLRVALLWSLWCASNRFIFKNEPLNVLQICQSARRDTICAGMARRSIVLKNWQNCGETHKSKLEQEFISIWCCKEVFCKGGLHSPPVAVHPGPHHEPEALDLEPRLIVLRFFLPWFSLGFGGFFALI